MKKIFTTIIIALTFGIFSNKVNAQVEQGNIIIEPYYGFSLSNAYLKSLETNSVYDVSSKTTNIGPFGFRGEFLVSDLIGVGVDINYRKSTFTGEYTSNSNVYSDTYTVTQTRLMARMNFHFIHDGSIDFYSGLGIGYKMSPREFSSTDPYATPESYDAILPIAFRMSAGFRYFFIDNLGVGAEVGIGGGSFANIGITAKF